MSPSAAIDVNDTKVAPSGTTASSIRLDGKVALVTGSSRGIGRGIALHLAACGANVIINYVKSATAAEEVVAEIKAMGRKSVAIQADVSIFEDIQRLFDEAERAMGKLDIVMSNSGTECFADLEETTPELYDRVMNINTRGQFFVAQQGYMHMNQHGRIILMSSVAAHLRGLKGHSIYSASKAAIEAMVRSFPDDFAPKKVTVNAIAPGGVATQMAVENAYRYTPGGKPDMSLDDIYDGLASICPLGRFGLPVDIAKTVAFLASDDSEWVNGQTIGLTGGSRC
ncbi:Hydroxynaphthalene reductase-like protein Arp2 [Cladobotryum mycophilum]|uniref:Hydroxynaphthalene reductase-like protein Arp2 n=1 Tax=Cladobotryum mycophilum TaxID=491253 RepID=A0ABR0SN80_9HYPO